MATQMGMEFMNWQNAPSLTEALKKGNSPLLGTLGILMAGDGDKEELTIEPSGVPPVGEAGLRIPSAIAPPSGMGLKANSAPPGLSAAPTLPTLPTLPQLGQAGQDLNHDGLVDSFWGVTGK